jgi:hypothetical protein
LKATCPFLGILKRRPISVQWEWGVVNRYNYFERQIWFKLIFVNL